MVYTFTRAVSSLHVRLGEKVVGGEAEKSTHDRKAFPEGKEGKGREGMERKGAKPLAYCGKLNLVAYGTSPTKTSITFSTRSVGLLLQSRENGLRYSTITLLACRRISTILNRLELANHLTILVRQRNLP